MTIRTSKLVFVYNANSGWGNKVMDSTHKLLSPKTYVCNLCDITYGVFAEDKSWRRFRKESLIQMEFLHKDEFLNQYNDLIKKPISFPVILKFEKKQLQVFCGTSELNKVNNVQELMAIIEERV